MSTFAYDTDGVTITTGSKTWKIEFDMKLRCCEEHGWFFLNAEKQCIKGHDNITTTIVAGKPRITDTEFDVVAWLRLPEKTCPPNGHTYEGYDEVTDEWVYDTGVCSVENWDDGTGIRNRWWKPEEYKKDAPNNALDGSCYNIFHFYTRACKCDDYFWYTLADRVDLGTDRTANDRKPKKYVHSLRCTRITIPTT
jgi:hypothetical protein